LTITTENALSTIWVAMLLLAAVTALYGIVATTDRLLEPLRYHRPCPKVRARSGCRCRHCRRRCDCRQVRP
jgi:hypothetical protein